MVDIGLGKTALTHREAPGAPGWWGASFLLVADATLLASLLFGYAFLWTIAPNWPAPQTMDGGAILGCIAAAALSGGTLMARRALASVKIADQTRLPAIAALMQGTACAALAALAVTALPPPASHAYAATSWALLVYAALHAGIAATCNIFSAARIGAGYVSAARNQELAIARLFSDYAAAAGIVILLTLLAPGLIR